MAGSTRRTLAEALAVSPLRHRTRETGILLHASPERLLDSSRSAQQAAGSVWGDCPFSVRAAQSHGRLEKGWRSPSECRARTRRGSWAAKADCRTTRLLPRICASLGDRRRFGSGWNPLREQWELRITSA